MEADREPSMPDGTGTLDAPRVLEAPVLSLMRDPEPAPGAEIPRATYRVQLNKSFTFRDVTEIVPYLDILSFKSCDICTLPRHTEF